MSRFTPSAFDFDVVTDDTGSRGPRLHRIDPPPLEKPAAPRKSPEETAKQPDAGASKPC